MANRTILAISDQALAIIAKRAPSANKKGAWVSEAIVAYDKMLTTNELSDPARLARIETEMQEIKQMLNQITSVETDHEAIDGLSDWLTEIKLEKATFSDSTYEGLTTESILDRCGSIDKSIMASYLFDAPVTPAKASAFVKLMRLIHKAKNMKDETPVQTSKGILVAAKAFLNAERYNALEAFVEVNK